MTPELDSSVAFETPEGLLGEGQLVNIVRISDHPSPIAIVVDYYAAIVRQIPLNMLMRGERNDDDVLYPWLVVKQPPGEPSRTVGRDFPLVPYRTVNFYDLVGFETVGGYRTGNIIRFDGHNNQTAVIVAAVEPGTIGVLKMPLETLTVLKHYRDGEIAGPRWSLPPGEHKRWVASLRLKIVEQALVKFPDKIRQDVLDRASKALTEAGIQLPAPKVAVSQEPRRSEDRQRTAATSRAGVTTLAVVKSVDRDPEY